MQIPFAMRLDNGQPIHLQELGLLFHGREYQVFYHPCDDDVPALWVEKFNCRRHGPYWPTQDDVLCRVGNNPWEIEAGEKSISRIRDKRRRSYRRAKAAHLQKDRALRRSFFMGLFPFLRQAA